MVAIAGIIGLGLAFFGTLFFIGLGRDSSAREQEQLQAFTIWQMEGQFRE